MPMPEPRYYEFGSPDDLLAAVDAAKALGFSRLDAYTPYQVPELDEKLGLRRTTLPLAVLFFGLVGCAFAYWLMWFCNALDFPLNVGGRPLNSIPADIPIMFETTVLFAGTTAFFAVLFLSRMPRLHHPIHEIPGSAGITIDRFWLAVEDDPSGDARLREQMFALGALGVRMRSGGET
jgi:hypothetical protein